MMTKAFFEPTIVTKKNEKRIRVAFSPDSQKKIKEFEQKARTTLRKTDAQPKLTLDDLR